MKILFVNNFSYQKGGAEISLFSTAKLLQQKENKVYYFFADKLKLNPLNLFYSFKSRREIIKILDRIKPDIVHLHNIYHRLTPSIIDIVSERNIPIIMTLHDYKLVCAVYKLWRKGRACEDCTHKNYFNILKNNCNLKGKVGESILLWTEMNLHHNILKIYDKINAFISPSKFLIQKFKDMGWKRKIYYLPNFVDAKNAKIDAKDAKTIVYFGRLAPEKGLDVLLEAFKMASSPSTGSTKLTTSPLRAGIQPFDWFDKAHHKSAQGRHPALS